MTDSGLVPPDKYGVMQELFDSVCGHGDGMTREEFVQVRTGFVRVAEIILPHLCRRAAGLCSFVEAVDCWTAAWTSQL
jgi:hypothetical protein